MPDYKKMYFQLVAKVANAVDILVDAQQQGEDDFVESENLSISSPDVEPEVKEDNMAIHHSN